MRTSSGSTFMYDYINIVCRKLASFLKKKKKNHISQIFLIIVKVQREVSTRAKHVIQNDINHTAEDAMRMTRRRLGTLQSELAHLPFITLVVYKAT